MRDEIRKRLKKDNYDTKSRNYDINIKIIK